MTPEFSRENTNVRSFGNFARLEHGKIIPTQETYSLQEAAILTALPSDEIKKDLEMGTGLTLELVGERMASEAAEKIRAMELHLSQILHEPVWCSNRVFAAFGENRFIFREAKDAASVYTLRPDPVFDDQMSSGIQFHRESEIRTMFKWAQEEYPATKVIDFVGEQPFVYEGSYLEEPEEVGEEENQPVFRPLVYSLDRVSSTHSLLKSVLSVQGFDFVGSVKPDEAYDVLKKREPDIILVSSELDIAEARQSGRPFLYIANPDIDEDIARILDLGADNAVERPYSVEDAIEFSAYIRSILRRRSGELGETLGTVVVSGDLLVDLDARRAFKGGTELSFTRTEWLLLSHLAREGNKVVLNAQLLEDAWGEEYREDLQYLRVWVSRLRDKLGESPTDPKHIKTLPGIGYVFIETYQEIEKKKLQLGGAFEGKRTADKPVVLLVNPDFSIINVMKGGLKDLEVLTVQSEVEAGDLLDRQVVDLAVVDDSFAVEGNEVPYAIFSKSARASAKQYPDAVAFLNLKDLSGISFGTKVRVIADGVYKRRFAAEVSDYELKDDGLEVSLSRRLVKKDGKHVHLTATEWKLLEFFTEKYGNILEYDQIANNVWGVDRLDDMQYLRVHISRLKSAIGKRLDDSDFIENVSGVGYVFGKLKPTRENAQKLASARSGGMRKFINDPRAINN